MELIREYIAPLPNTGIMVLFGGSPERMNEVISLIREQLNTITAIGFFSEEEGLNALAGMPKVDLVLIGGRYTEAQRIRIRDFLAKHFPSVATTEPGYHYPYQNSEILEDIRRKMKQN